jgi:WD40 repeat protein
MKPSNTKLALCFLAALSFVANANLTHSKHLSVTRKKVAVNASSKPYSQRKSDAQAKPADTPNAVLALRATLRDYRGPSQTKGQPALLAFSPDDKIIAYRTGVRSVVLADTATGERRALLNVEKGGLDAFAFSPDGMLVATRYVPNKELLIWDAATGKLQRTLDGIKEAGRLAKNRGAATVLLRKELARVPFSPDGAFIVNDQPGDITALWNVGRGEVEKQFDRETQISPKRHLLKQMFSGGLFSVPQFFFEDAQWSADGKFLVTLDRDQTPKLWNVLTGKLHAVIAAPSDKVKTVTFAPNGQVVATLNRDGELKLLDVASGELLAVPERQGVENVTWKSDGSLIALGGIEREVKLFDVRSKEMRFTLALSRGQLTGGRSLLEGRGGPNFSPDGSRVATGGSRREAAMVWDVETGKLLYALPKGEDDTQSLTWSPDGRLLVTANDEAATVWDAATGRLIQKLAGGARSPAHFSRDGRTLATGARDNTALLWSVAAQ